MKKDKRAVRNTTTKSKLLYNSIQFRSALEMYTYKQLIKHGLEANYETLVLELYPKSTFLGKWLESAKKGLKQASSTILPMTYLPDFVSNDGTWIIECKGWQGADKWAIKKKLIKLYLKDNANIAFYVPRTQKEVDESINEILTWKQIIWNKTILNH